jgi:protein MAK11
MSCSQRPIPPLWWIRRNNKVYPLYSRSYHRIYDLKKRKDLGSLSQHIGAVTALQFYSRTHLLSASEDGTICIWRTRDWECMATMKGHKGRVNGMCVHPSGKIGISVGKDKALRLWNLMTGRKASANKLGEGIFSIVTCLTGRSV